MKKLLLTITLILALTLTSCGNKTIEEVSSTETSETVTSQTSSAISSEEISIEVSSQTNSNEVLSIPSYSAEQNEVSSYLMSNSNIEYDMLYPISVDGKYGYIDINGNTVIDLVLDDAAPFSEGLASVKSDGLHGYIDLSGDLVIPFKYSTSRKFSNGRAAVRETKKLDGYINTSGELVIDYQFGHGFEFSEGVARVYLYDSELENVELVRGAYIDINGNVYDSFTSINGFRTGDKHDGLVRLGLAYYNMEGEEVIEECIERPINENFPYDFSDGLAVYPFFKRENWENLDENEFYYDLDNWNCIYINTKGEQVLTIFDKAEPFWEGLARVEKDDVASVIDKTGKVIFNHSGLVSNCSEGYFVYEENDNYGFVNNKGEVAIEAQYDLGTGEFSMAGHTAWYDETARLTGQFSNGLAYMVKGDKEMYINKSGEVVWEKEREDED